MARQFAKIWLRRANDPKWCALSIRAQWLYDALLASPSLTNAGELEWKPKRVAKLAGALSVDEVEAALDELRLNLFVVLDQDTDDLLIRSYIRNDVIATNTKLMLGVTTAFSKIGSIDLKQVFMHEMHRLRHENPDAGIWSEKKMVEMFDTTDPISAHDYALATWPEYGKFHRLDSPFNQGSDPVFRMDPVDA